MTATGTLERNEKTITETPQLQVADRGDCCGAQAFVRATKGDSTLLFCGHHFRKNEAGLTSTGWGIDDQRDRINEKPSVSANQED